MAHAVAVLIPLMRPHKIAPLVANIHECTNDPNVVVIATGECARACDGLSVQLIEDDGGTWPQRINRGFHACKERYVTLAADDVWFLPGWFEAVMRVMDRINGVVALADGYNASGVHFVADRAYVQECGAVLDSPGDLVSEAYQHAYTDDEFRSTARFHGRYEYAPDARIEHHHAGSGRSPMDDVYRMGEATMQSGLATYQSRAHLWSR